jgi:hypothetical protein
MAALGGGSGTNSGNGSIDPMSMSLSRVGLSSESDSGPDLLVVQPDGSTFPLKLLPQGIDTNGMVLIDASPESETVPSFNANAFGAEGETPAGISDGGCDCPSYGFFRVWHIPDYLADVTDYVFDGPTFIPVDYKDYDDRVGAMTLLINGVASTNAEYTEYDYGGQTNFGVGFYCDRLTNGTYTVQMLTTLRTTDIYDGNDTSMVLSNLPRTITISNEVTFPNWVDLISSNTYPLLAQSTTTNVDWEIDIYDINNNFVNSQTGHSDDGSIEWDWDLMDYSGNSRTDTDADPDFYPYIIITPSGSFSPHTPRPARSMPPVAAKYPDVGGWIFAYLDNFNTDGVTNQEFRNEYYTNAINLMCGGPATWSIPFIKYPIKYGLTYTNGEREQSWITLRSLMFQPTYRNFYYSGHGWATGIGGDFNVTDGSNNITAGQTFPRSKAYLGSQWVHDNITFNKYAGARPYRFVFLDGCNTANGDWPGAFGMPKQVEPLSYYQGTPNRPSAFVGWNVTVGGKPEWGTLQNYWAYRQDWMADWAINYYSDGLKDQLDEANYDSNWINISFLHDHMRIYGYDEIGFREYNRSGDWP